MDSTSFNRQPIRSRRGARSSPLRRNWWRLLAFVFIAITGCSGTATRSAENTNSPVQSIEPENSLVNKHIESFGSTEARTSQQQMAILWQTRRQDQTRSDYPIGAGD